MVVDSSSPSEWPWGPVVSSDACFPLPESRILRIVRSGNLLRSWVKTNDNAADGADVTDAGSAADDPVAGADVTIFSEDDELDYLPELPDTAIVLRAAHGLSLIPGSTIETFVPVPLVPTLAIRNGDSPAVPFLRFPASGLSKTWFGEPSAGERACALNTPLSEDYMGRPNDPWKAICPLTLVNSSSDIFSFERFILRVTFLTLYSGSGQLYTNGVTVNYLGEGQMSSVKIDPSPPSDPANLKVFAEPRETDQNKILRRSFSLIKTLTKH